ncbi:acetylcholine receptor subunit alpha-type unc-38-like [Penaeus japonicus]|uniref:acetylcholine receptor subunit alpha-type unc-38-like n=1 Tax=Penaeus japonicus TaxID=27405 RepID=UPI001C70D7EB|nr:acetylcholine receptor subunit alpha-type unc-38-like [Penaeus japonicus]
MIMKWEDHYLTWDPKDYNNTQMIHVPYTDIWYPDIILYNTADSNYQNGIINTNAIISYTGEVELVSHVMFQSTCNVDIEWYPFDQQDCKLHFASWTYDMTKIQLIQGPADISEYTPHPEFFLEDFFSEIKLSHDPCCINPFSTMIYHVQVQRRTMFAIFFFIMPGTIVNLCALLTFLLPAESGEKISLSTNALLAMMVFLMAMTQDIPPTEQVPLIGKYYGVCIAMLAVNISCSVVTLRLHFSIGTPVPRAVSKFAQFLGRVLYVPPPEELKLKWMRSANSKVEPRSSLSGKILGTKLIHIDPAAPADATPKGNDFKDDYQCRTVNALEGIQHLLQNRFGSGDGLSTSSTSIHHTEWRYVCVVADKLFFLVFLVLFIIFNSIILLSSPHEAVFGYCPDGPGTCPEGWDGDYYGEKIEAGEGFHPNEEGLVEAH